MQSMGKNVKATLLSLSRDVIFQISAVIVLPKWYGLVGAFWSVPLSE